MLLFQMRTEDQEDKSLVVVRDYSLKKRRKTPFIDKISMFQKQQALVDENEKTKLASLEIDIEKPLSKIDWHNLGNTIGETQGFGWI